MKRLSVFLLMLGALLHVVAAPAVKTVEGVYTFYGDDSHSRKDCDRLALEGARLNALAKAFGTVLTQSTMSDVRTADGGEQNNFAQISETDVKGEWIEDIGEPEFTRSMDADGNMVVTCKVRGRAREISNEAPDFIAEVLRNGNTRGQSTTTFRSGDDMALYVQTPVDGYLVVYLVGADRRAYTLLPYINSDGGYARLRHGKEYVFFNEEKAAPEHGEPDVMVMLTEEPVEYNTLYVVFSPKAFNKAPDEYQGDGVPRSLPFNDFYSWLGKARRNDPSMAVKKIQLTINQ